MSPGLFGYPALPARNIPARRASVVMIVLGSAMLLMGFCFTFFGVFIRNHPELIQPGMQIPAVEGMSQLQVLRLMAFVVGIGSVLDGILFIVFGCLVRGGGKIAVNLSIVVCTLTGLFLLLQTLGCVALIPAQPINAIFALIMLAVPLAAIGMAINWLFRAVRQAQGQSATAELHQAQMWYHEQQQAAYSGYGGYAPTLTSPLPPPLPAPSASLPMGSTQAESSPEGTLPPPPANPGGESGPR